MDGETFQPWPRKRECISPLPSVAIPPWPLVPSMFSGEIDLVLARDKRESVPISAPRPLNIILSPLDSVLVDLL